MSLALCPRGALWVHFRSEAIPVLEYERHGDRITIYVNLYACLYNGYWTFPAAALEALRLAQRSEAAA